MAIPGLNKDVLDKAIKVLGLQSAVEKLPTTLAPTIQPVLDLNPERIVDVVATRGSTGTLYAVPDGKDFYLTSCCISCGSINQNGIQINRIAITLESGETVNLCACINGSEAAGVKNNTTVVPYNPPIKVKSGTNITCSEASSDAEFFITGYLVDIL